MQIARMRKAADLARQIEGGWYVCQHLNPLNPQAHSKYTAREIERAYPEPPDAIVVGVSTAGQISGLAQALKTRHPQIHFVGVDVDTPRHPYKMTGLGLSFVPPAFDPKILSAAYGVSDTLAFSMCRELARREGLLLGASSGAIVCAGLAYAAQHPTHKRILLINPDRGDRYLETIYCDDWIQKSGLNLVLGQKLFDQCANLNPVPRDILLGEK